MKTLILDFDDTIVNSSKAFCSVYNMVYGSSKGFKPADWTKTNKWNYRDICPLLEDDPEMVEEIFDTKLFFKFLDFHDGAKNALEKLSKSYKLVICSIGKPDNIARKSTWIARNLPFVENVILIRNNGNQMNKSIVNMRGAILVDDVASNLESSNAETKICFGSVREANKDWDGYRVFSWKELECALSKDEAEDFS